MGRTYDEWIKTQDQALVASTRKGDEASLFSHCVYLSRSNPVK